MKTILLILIIGIIFLSFSCQNPHKKDAAKSKQDSLVVISSLNMLTTEESNNGWLLLFDGKTTSGWRGYNKAEFPAGWEIVDNSLHCTGAENGIDLIYGKKFKNFHLKLEWKISAAGNSGIFYLGQEIPEWPIYKTAPEMQVIDNMNHLDAQMGKDGNRKSGSLYDLIPSKPQNAKPIGEWNSAEIIVNKGNVIHRQNGEKVLEYDLWSDDWKKLVAESKFPNLNQNWADVATEGYIAFQDYGDEVWFRNVKIKELQ